MNPATTVLQTAAAPGGTGLIGALEVSLESPWEERRRAREVLTWRSGSLRGVPVDDVAQLVEDLLVEVLIRETHQR